MSIRQNFKKTKRKLNASFRWMVMWLLTCPLAERNSRHLQNKLIYLHKHSNRAQLFSVTCARFGRITKVKLSESTYPIYANSESSTSTQRCEISHISKPTGLTTITVSCALFCFLKKILQTMYIQKNMYLSYPFLNLKPIHKILPFDTFRSGPTVTIWP